MPSTGWVSSFFGWVDKTVQSRKIRARGYKQREMHGVLVIHTKTQYGQKKMYKVSLHSVSQRRRLGASASACVRARLIDRDFLFLMSQRPFAYSPDEGIHMGRRTRLCKTPNDSLSIYFPSQHFDCSSGDSIHPRSARDTFTSE